MHHMISTFSAAATLSSVAQGLAPPRGAASPAPAETLAEMLLRKENARLQDGKSL